MIGDQGGPGTYISGHPYLPVRTSTLRVVYRGIHPDRRRSRDPTRASKDHHRRWYPSPKLGLRAT